MIPSWWPSEKPYQIRDCLEGMKEIPDKSVDLLIADPPYNENKADWDHNHDYLPWWQECVSQFTRILKPNGVLYFFQMNIETAMDMHHICKENALRLRQMIVIDKGLMSVARRTSQSVRSFPKATEYLFYYTFQDTTGAEQLSDTYCRINPMARYLRDEIDRSGTTHGELTRLFPSKTDGETGCVRNWLKGYNFPLRWQYAKIRDYLNRGGMASYLRREYETLRYTFNLPYGITDVWAFNFYEDKVGEHETPKPVKLIERILRASSEPGGIIFDPFLGSGTSLLAARRTNRICLGFEIDAKYEPLILNRMKANIPSIESFESEEEEPEITINCEKVKE